MMVFQNSFNYYAPLNPEVISRISLEEEVDLLRASTPMKNLIKQVLQIVSQMELPPNNKKNWKSITRIYNIGRPESEQYTKEKLQHKLQAYLKIIHRGYKNSGELTSPAITSRELCDEVIKIASTLDLPNNMMIPWEIITQRYNVGRQPQQQLTMEFIANRLELYLSTIRLNFKNSKEFDQNSLISRKPENQKSFMTEVLEIVQGLEATKNGRIPWTNMHIEYNRKQFVDNKLPYTTFRAKLANSVDLIEKNLKNNTNYFLTKQKNTQLLEAIIKIAKTIERPRSSYIPWNRLASLYNSTIPPPPIQFTGIQLRTRLIKEKDKIRESFIVIKTNRISSEFFGQQQAPLPAISLIPAPPIPAPPILATSITSSSHLPPPPFLITSSFQYPAPSHLITPMPSPLIPFSPFAPSNSSLLPPLPFTYPPLSITNLSLSPSCFPMPSPIPITPLTCSNSFQVASSEKPTLGTLHKGGTKRLLNQPPQLFNKKPK